jgi:hypothetical protein
MMSSYRGESNLAPDRFLTGFDSGGIDVQAVWASDIKIPDTSTSNGGGSVETATTVEGLANAEICASGNHFAGPRSTGLSVPPLLWTPTSRAAHPRRSVFACDCAN